MRSAKKSISLSNLHDCLLVMIISKLPFKESVRTSLLSKRWRYLCRETTSIVFKESEFMKISVFNRKTVEPTRLDKLFFVRVMRDWVSRFNGKVIENFELHLSQPIGFEEDIMSLTKFAASRHVKNLVLDFSDPSQRNISLAEHARRDRIRRCMSPQKNKLDVSHLFFNFLYVRTLTVSSFLLQVKLIFTILVI